MDDAELFQLMRPRKVCVCHQVSEADILACIRSGAKDLSAISQATLASTNCGTCSGAIRRILEKELQCETQENPKKP